MLSNQKEPQNKKLSINILTSQYMFDTLLTEKLECNRRQGFS